jgi:hypothetical protein
MSVNPQDGHALAFAGDMAGYCADGSHGDAVIPPDDERALPFRQGGKRLVMDGLDPAGYDLGMIAQAGNVSGWPGMWGSRSNIPTINDLMAKDGKRIGQARDPRGCGA